MPAAKSILREYAKRSGRSGARVRHHPADYAGGHDEPRERLDGGGVDQPAQPQESS